MRMEMTKFTSILIVCGIMGPLAFAQSESNELAPLTVNGGDTENAKIDKIGDEEPESDDSEKPEKDPEEMVRETELKRLKNERDLIQARMALRSEKFKEELQEMREEKERLAMENSVYRERLASELSERKAETDRLNAKIDSLSKEISLESLESKKAMNDELAELRMEEERLKLVNSVALKKIETEINQLRLEDARLKTRRAKLDLEVVELTAKLPVKEKSDMVEDLIYSDRELMYLKEPFVDGVLHVSDRRIPLNGPIWSGLADYVSERINFYNNESTEYPIFLVIDSSPGGSVMSGYKILKSMQGSKAPVYVVVKSYAASMAAGIATLAERSYCYPNAVVLHHQISWGGMGNLTQQREFLEEAEEWWRRVARPIAEKMGLNLEKFIVMMYEKNSDGDWREFGDEAVKLKWIDHSVDRIWEMSIDKNPGRFGSSVIFAHDELLKEELGDDGRPFIALPRLEPFDFYYLYNPDFYYRLR